MEVTTVAMHNYFQLLKFYSFYIGSEVRHGRYGFFFRRRFWGHWELLKPDQEVVSLAVTISEFLHNFGSCLGNYLTWTFSFKNAEYVNISVSHLCIQNSRCMLQLVSRTQHPLNQLNVKQLNFLCWQKWFLCCFMLLNKRKFHFQPHDYCALPYLTRLLT